MYRLRLRPSSKPQHSQAGAALLVSLIMLLLMTLIGVTAMKTTLLETKMAGNVQAEIQAFNRAESGLRDGEEFIKNTIIGPIPYTFGDHQGVYDASSGSAAIVWDGNWNGYAMSSQSGRQIIEYIGSENLEGESAASGSGTSTAGTTIYLFRVTARSDTNSTEPAKIVRSIYATLDPPS